MSSARLLNTVDGSTRDIDIAGAFIAVGHDPQSQLVAGQVDLDPNGYVVTALLQLGSCGAPNTALGYNAGASITVGNNNSASGSLTVSDGKVTESSTANGATVGQNSGSKGSLLVSAFGTVALGPDELAAWLRERT